METDFDYPAGGFLLATQDALCSYYAGVGVYGAVEDVYADDMGAFGIGVLVPHPNYYMRPGMSRTADK